MKRLLYALAVLVLASTPVQAEFKGTLQREQAWLLEVASASPETTAMFAGFVDRLGNVEGQVIQVSEPVQEILFPKPGRGVTRIIVEVDLAVVF